ncbi:MAG: DUF881 domain-containing protein [Clostridiaceae bacterium]|nr:DUF881 domain-containing protein [Clostridiaceae bacterium]
MFIVFLLLGMLISLQFRGIINNQENNISVREMALRLEAEEAEGRKLLEELNSLETEWSQLLNNIGSRQQDPEIMELIRQRDYEYFRAGLTNVKGDGIVITMQDAQTAGDMNIKDYIIHDADITGILNELRSNGAEAISINGERILGTSKLVCAGPTIFLNKSRYPPPYVIKAIGDPDTLYDAIDQLPNVAVMRLYGIRIDIRKEYDMIIEKYRLYESVSEWLSNLEVATE